MYRKKSLISALLTIITAALCIGFMIMVPTLKYDVEEGGLGAVFFIFLFGAFGNALIYIGQIPFVIVALIFGIKMLLNQSREKLISYNIRMLITTCVLLPFVAVGLIYIYDLYLQSVIGLFSGIYTIAVAVAYVAGLITQIVTIVVLKKSD